MGGGGYDIANTARYWTYLTSVICGQSIDDDIPENRFFLNYGPGYELNIDVKNFKDLNTDEEFEQHFKIIQGEHVASIYKIKFNFLFLFFYYSDNLKKYMVCPFNNSS